MIYNLPPTRAFRDYIIFVKYPINCERIGQDYRSVGLDLRYIHGIQIVWFVSNMKTSVF